VAILAYFQKTGEDPRMIRYRWGGDPDTMDRELVMEKATARLLPGDEPPTVQQMAAVRKIYTLKERTGVWPEQGMTAS
jgi:hypothetical protein